MYQFQNDRYKKARGGKSRLLDISCTRCGQHVAYYQKDGPGLLKRMYVDRFVDVKPDGSTLVCTGCNAVLGQQITYKKENRLAYHLSLGAVHKQITSL